MLNVPLLCVMGDQEPYRANPFALRLHQMRTTELRPEVYGHVCGIYFQISFSDLRFVVFPLLSYSYIEQL